MLSGYRFSRLAAVKRNSLSWVVVVGSLCGSLACDESSGQTSSATRGNLAKLTVRQVSDPATLQTALYQEERQNGRDTLRASELAEALGVALRARGQFSQARPHLQRALEGFKRHLGDRDPRTTEARIELGLLHEKLGERKQSQDAYLKALEIQKATGRDKDDLTITILTNLGTLSAATEDYATGKRYLQAALALQEQLYPQENRETATILSNLGYLHSRMGDLAAAARYQEKTLAIRRRLLPAGHADVARSLGNLGVLQAKVGDYEKASALLSECIAIMKRSAGGHPDLASFESSLAMVNVRLGQSRGAISELEQTLKRQTAAFGTQSPEVVRIRSNLGHLLHKAGRHREALDHLTEAVNVSTVVNGAIHTETARARNNLAGVLFSIGSDEAEKHMRTTLETVRGNLGDEHPSTVLAMDNLAAVQALGNRWQTAVEVADACQQIRRRLLFRVLAEMTDEQQYYLLAASRDSFEGSLSIGVATPGAAAVEKSAEWAMNGKGVGHAAMLKAIGLDAGDGAPAGRDWATLDAVRSRIPASAVLVEFVALQPRRFSRDGLSVDEEHYYAWVAPPARKAAVRFVDLGKSAPIKALVAQVRLSIDQFGQLSTASKSSQRKRLREKLDEQLSKLTELIFAPLFPDRDYPEQLVLCPDNDLWLTPWAALRIDEGYLVEHCAVRYLISGRDLLWTSAHKPASAPVIFADPNFDVSPEALRGVAPGQISDRAAPPVKFARAERLPGTAKEAALIRPHLSKRYGIEPLVHLDGDARESTVRSISRPSALVFSTHGFFVAPAEESEAVTIASSATKPLAFSHPLLRCGLLLAGCNSPQLSTTDDGVLTGLEVARLDLRGTELVVLSACETGLGSAHTGEGIAGLRQAFQMAGGQAVLSTLWSIPDNETADLMGRYFESIAEGKSNADALREAQRKIMDQLRHDHQFADPHLWAAFTITGR